jgi:hypothetical protein
MWSAAHAAHQIGGFVTMIRPLRLELEEFLEKSGNFLPVSGFGRVIGVAQMGSKADLSIAFCTIH